ncbi:TPA: hypothetical protein N2D16_002862 [Clostridium botulinum]|nr:hypothetical protein [Clostridium botulinum]HCL4455238.1 hypothetical protein [Clostridium botulinum]
MDIYSNVYYSTFIRKNNKKDGYIGFIGKKIAFLPKDFKLPSYLKEGKYHILGKYIEDRGNYFVINKIKINSLFDILEMPKCFFEKNSNNELFYYNNIPIISKCNYVELKINGVTTKICCYKRTGNKRPVEMTLIRVGNQFSILNDTSPFSIKNGIIPQDKLERIIEILNYKYSIPTKNYLISEFLYLTEFSYQDTLKRVQNSTLTLEEEKSLETQKTNLKSIIADAIDYTDDCNLNLDECTRILLDMLEIKR